MIVAFNNQIQLFDFLILTVAEKTGTCIIEIFGKHNQGLFEVGITLYKKISKKTFHGFGLQECCKELNYPNDRNRKNKFFNFDKYL